MNMQKYCPKGHAYDSSLPECPFCLPSQSSVGSTTPVGNIGGVGPTTPVGNIGGVGPTIPVNQAQSQQKTTFIGDLEDPNATVPQKPAPPPRVRPVVGWLVCVKGVDIGKDFRLHTDFNRVGRSENQDVCLSDETVSREHFTISYDRINNRYFAEMGSGASMVYINGHSLGGRPMLKKGDQISVGNTLLVFIPLEQQDVKWNWKI